MNETISLVLRIFLILLSKHVPEVGIDAVSEHLILEVERFLAEVTLVGKHFVHEALMGA